MKNILVTGGCGFIGANFCHMLAQKGDKIFVLDKLTYAAEPQNIATVPHKFFKSCIGNVDFVSHILEEYDIDRVVNFAAESHVDNSIENPEIFIDSNVNAVGGFLRACLGYHAKKPSFRLVHVSTDEVFGDLPFDDSKFREDTPYKPSSPYSASKAASDHLVHAYVRTYGLDAVITNCSNNYGPMQNREKLIPKTISNCVAGKPLTIYGNGANVRDWIHVRDHCEGVYLAMEKGIKGQSYCFGGNCEVSVKDMVRIICELMNEHRPGKEKYENLIVNIADRKGHDLRYAIDDSKSSKDLGFTRANSDLKTNLINIINSFPII